jgi:hypothetical protein
MPKLGETRRGNAGKGRAKGSTNKLTKTVKEAIEIAFNNVGGHKYLERMADKEPKAFLALLGKVIPQQINANVQAALLPGSIDDFV